MKKNMGITDRFVRLLVAVFISFLFFANNITWSAAVTLFFLGVSLLLTGLTGFCIVYDLLGINTLKNKNSHGTT
jgi:hypothetical protein